MRRPDHPEWDEYFRTELAPSLRARTVVPLLESEHIYLTSPNFDGLKFSKNFRECWESLPTDVTSAILVHWNTPRKLILDKYPHIPYLLLNDLLIGDEDEGPGVTAAKVMEQGFLVQFWAPVFDLFPDEIAKTVIAHELAHVFQFSQRANPRDELGEGGMEREADRLMKRWGYDMADVERWACQRSKGGPKSDEAIQDLIQRSKSTRYAGG